MRMAGNKLRLVIMLLCGLGYVVVGLAFGALANASAGHAREAWRLSAFAVSAALFVSQFVFEYRRAGRTPSEVAAYCALAVALGAFGLAAAGRLRTALVVWPGVTGVPAFVAAWVAGRLLAHRQTRA